MFESLNVQDVQKFSYFEKERKTALEASRIPFGNKGNVILWKTKIS
jgi:hypothetical protein